MKHLALLLALLVPAPALATWSVIAVDRSSGQVIIASATACGSRASLPSPPGI